MSLIERVYKRYVLPRVIAQTGEDAEAAHEWGLSRLVDLQNDPILLSLARVAFRYHHPMLRTQAFGLQFAHPLGLAAGFDKYCRVYHTAVPAFGWSFAEVGGITCHEQDGNPRTPPRMRRSMEHQALWDFMGFNNAGADKAGTRMSMSPKSLIPVGVNVGKSKITALEKAAGDYCYTIRRLWPFVDFITLNPSSPNTPGLRSLQSKNNLVLLVIAAQNANREMAGFTGRKPIPLGVKISPDETEEQLADIVDVCRQTHVDFVITTNTTVKRDNTRGWDIPSDRGGVSGRPLWPSSVRVQRSLARQLRGEIPIIGVGGIFDGNDLYQRILSGASLCQVYTAWPFEGPDFVKRCLKQLVLRLKLGGFQTVSEAVGATL